MKKLIISIGVIGLLTGCSDKIETIGNNLDERMTASVIRGIEKPTCPESLEGVIYVNHTIEQNMEKDELKFETSGRIPFIMKSDEITGRGNLKNHLSGKFSDCDLVADRNVTVQISGICNENVLKMTISEKYQGSSTEVCGEQMFLSEVPLTHEVDMLIEEDYTFEDPYKGEIGTGAYQWKLSLKPLEEQVSQSVIKTPPRGMRVIPADEN